MARSSSPSVVSLAGAGRGAVMEENHKPGGPAPMPHDERRWRVAPATDGRETPEGHKPAPRHRVRWF